MAAPERLRIRRLARREHAAADAVLPLHRLDQPRSEYLVAWRGAEPVGHVCVEWCDPPELQDLWVLPERRSQGIGTALVAAVEARVARRGHDAVRLTVSVGNAGAARLYERLGYRRTGHPPRRVRGRIVLRGRPFDVDDTLVDYAKAVPARPAR